MLTIIESVVDPATASQWLNELRSATWEDGSASAGSAARRVKRNRQLPVQTALHQRLSAALIAHVQANATFMSAALPARVFPPRFNRYDVGGQYGVHVDGAIMPDGDGHPMRTDLSATVFLTEPDDYDGGELTVESNAGSQTIKLAAGDMVLYPANSLHRVTAVTSGSRISGFFWVQSLVADNTQREILFDLDQSIQSLHHTGDNSAAIDRLTGVYHNLIRQWAQP